jgi:Predicted permease
VTSNRIEQGRYAPHLAVLLAIPILYFAREVLIPLALAALFSFMLSAPVRRLELWHLGRTLSVSLVLILSFSAIAAVGWTVANQLVDAISHLSDYESNIRTKMQAIRNHPPSSLSKATSSVEKLSKELSIPEPDPSPAGSAGAIKLKNGRPAPAASGPVPVKVIEAAPNVVQAVRNTIGPLVGPLGTAGLVIVFTAFMLMNRVDLRDRLIRLVSHGHINVMTQALDEATQRVSRFLVMQFVVNTSFAVVLACGFYFIGVPNALLWGVLAGFLRFIPYLGSLIGGSLPFLLAIAVFPDWKRPLITFALFLVMELLVSNFIEPLAYGDRTGISSLAILVAAVFWTTLWGPLGLILSTPLTVCAVVLGRYVPQFGFLNVLLGDEPVLPPESRFYQRLLAMDLHEARAIVDEFLADRTLVDLYDLIIVPALSMAEEDRHKGALDATRENFIIDSVHELIVEIAERPEQPVGDGGGPELPTVRAGSPDGQVLCLTATDRADHLVATMLAQLLEQAGCSVVPLPPADSPLEGIKDAIKQLTRPEGRTAGVVCISALPPFALLNARTLSKRVREEYPDVRIVVGLWNFSGGGKTASERLGKAFADPVTTSLKDALQEICGSPDAPEAEAAAPEIKA